MSCALIPIDLDRRAPHPLARGHPGGPGQSVPGRRSGDRDPGMRTAPTQLTRRVRRWLSVAMTWPRMDGLRTLELGTPGELRQELIGLVLSGPKRATAGLLSDYEIEGEALETAGEKLVLIGD